MNRSNKEKAADSSPASKTKNKSKLSLKKHKRQISSFLSSNDKLPTRQIDLKINKQQFTAGTLLKEQGNNT